MPAKPGEVTPGDSGVPTDWASGAPVTDLVSGQLNAIEPPAGVKATGFVPFRIKPWRNVVNWLLQRGDEWQKYFDATCQRAATVVVVASDATNDSKRMAGLLDDGPPATVLLCDGTDDHLTINAAIALVAPTGGIVHLSEGNFSIRGAIGLTVTGVILEGSGRQSTRIFVDPAVAANFMMLDATSSFDVVVRDLDIDGNSGAHALEHTGVQVLLSSRLVVERCRIFGMNFVAAPGYGYGIAGGLCQSLALRDVWIGMCDLEALGLADTLDTVVMGCLFEAGGNTTPTVTFTQTVAGGRAARFIGNRVLGPGNAMPAVAWDHRGSIVADNYLDAEAAGQACIVVGDGVASDDYVIVHGNRCYRGNDGVYQNAAARCIVQGNLCRGQTGGAAGIYVAAGSDYAQILGNGIDDAAWYGIWVNGAHRCIVQGNRILTAGDDGVRGDNSDYLDMSDNFVTGAQQNGVHLVTCDQCGVKDNSFGLNGLSNALATADVKIEGCTTGKAHGNTREETNGAAGINQVEWAIYVCAAAGPVNSTQIMITDNMTRVAKNPGNNGIPGGGAVPGSSIQVDAAQTVLGYQGFLAGGTPVLDSNQQIL